MIITCQRCHTKFRVDDSLVSPLAKAKCTFCGNIFIMADGMAPEDFQKSIDAKEAAAAEAAQVVAEAESSKDAVEAILQDGDLYNVDGKARKQKKKPGLALWLVAILILLLGAGGAAYYLDLFGWRTPATVAQPETPPQDPAPQTGPVAENLITDQEELNKITLLDVKQYYVNNEKLGGQLFIIEGKVVNNFREPVDLIRVEATLLDENKNVIVSNQQFCGISVSYFQLQVLSEKELTDALSNKLEVLAKNMNVQPGSEVPFIFVFRSVPPTVRTFGVRVIEAQKQERPTEAP